MFRVIKDISGNLLKHPTDRYAFRSTDTIDTIVVHQTDSEDKGSFHPYHTANYHVNSKGWPGIAYHFMITKDGTIYQTNPTTSISYHAASYNDRSIGVVITGEHRIGSSTDNKDIIPKAEYNALIYLLTKLSLEYNIKTTNIVGHKDTPNTTKSCPNLIMPQIREDVAKKKESDDVASNFGFYIISDLISLFSQKIIEIKEYRNYKNYIEK